MQGLRDLGFTIDYVDCGGRGVLDRASVAFRAWLLVVLDRKNTLALTLRCNAQSQECSTILFLKIALAPLTSAHAVAMERI